MPEPTRRLPASPSGRVPQWVVDQSLGMPVKPVPFRAHTPPQPARAVRRSGGSRVGTAAVLLALTAGGLYARGLPAGTLSASSSTAAASGPVTGREEGHRGAAPPLTGAVEGQGFRFLGHQPESRKPVTWSPCRPVHYVVRPDHAPPGGAAILADAVAAVSAATGLRFVDDGATAEGPSEDRQSYQPHRYGRRWAPVLIAWATVDEVPDFGVDIAGEAGAVPVTTPSGDRTYVSGTVDLGADAVTRLVTGYGAPAAVAVVEHELGHLVGLAHVNDAQQVMYARGSQAFGYGAGDLAGLAALGHGACQPDV
jgi:hypothetical protein